MLIDKLISEYPLANIVRGNDEEILFTPYNSKTDLVFMASFDGSEVVIKHLGGREVKRF